MFRAVHPDDDAWHLLSFSVAFRFPLVPSTLRLGVPTRPGQGALPATRDSRARQARGTAAPEARPRLRCTRRYLHVCAAARTARLAGPRSMPPMDETGHAATIRVFLLDDHEIVRRGVRDLLDAEPGITVIGEAGTAASALARIPALNPTSPSSTSASPTATASPSAATCAPRCPSSPASCSPASATTRPSSTPSWPAPPATSSSKSAAPTWSAPSAPSPPASPSSTPRPPPPSCAACATRPPPPTPWPASPTRNAASSPSSAKA